MSCLFFDIDGTLIDYPRGLGRIPEDVAQELVRVRKSGRRLFLATGRPYPMVEPHLMEGFDGIVCSGGAHVVIDGVTVSEERLGRARARRIACALEAAGCAYLIECAELAYCGPGSQELFDYFARFGRTRGIERAFSRDEVLARALKLEANVSRQALPAVLAAASDAKAIVLAGAHDADFSVEVYGRGVSKAHGVELVLEALGERPCDAYAFGDGPIDQEMIELCGTGVAMGNATPELKAVSDVVCGSVGEHGLAGALRELFA